MRTWAQRQADGRDAFNVFADDCPSRPALEHVTGRWGGLVLGSLFEGRLRFSEIRRRVQGISEKMLSQTLQSLERDGLVTREARATNPPHVEYELTAAGSELAEAVLQLATLVEGRMWDVLSARERYDADHPAAPGAH
jgi:DNA-binding HxlR family transcriptional regulator